MKPDGHLTLSEAKAMSGYGGTSLRNAFDDPDQSLTGVRGEGRGGGMVRYYNEKSLLEWARTRSQGDRKLRSAEARRSAGGLVDNPSDGGDRSGQDGASAKMTEGDGHQKSSGSTQSELRELIEELQTENEGQAAAIEQLLDALVSEAESHYKQMARLAQAHKTTEAGRPGRRHVQDLLDDIAKLSDEQR